MIRMATWTFAIVLAAYGQANAEQRLTVAVPSGSDSVALAFFESMARSKSLVEESINLEIVKIDSTSVRMDVMDSVKDGKFNFGIVDLDSIINKDESSSFKYTSLIYQPGLVTDYLQQERILTSSIGDLISYEISSRDIVAIEIFAQLPQAIISKKTIENISDVQGLKVASSAENWGVLQAAGASPTQATGGELYMALEVGAFDAAQVPMSSEYKTLMEPVSGGTVINNYRQSAGVFIAGASAWLTLSAATQAAITDAAAEARAESSRAVADNLRSLDEAAYTNEVNRVEFSKVASSFVAETVPAVWLKQIGPSGEEALKYFYLIRESTDKIEPQKRGSLSDDEQRSVILFATNRNDESHPKAKFRFGSRRVDNTEVSCGRIVVSNTTNRSIGEIFSGQFNFDGDGVTSGFSDCSSYIAKYINLSSYPATIFIHGYNNTFNSAVRRAIGIHSDLAVNGPMIVWSWPSMGHVSGYVYDSDSAD